MPQYDAYEDPVPMKPSNTVITDGVRTRLQADRSPINKPLTTCHNEGINKPSDTDTPEISQTSPPSSPSTYHRRHSSLYRQEYPMQNAISSSPYPEPSTSQKNLSPAGKTQFADMERSQQQDDDIRIMLQADQGHANNIGNKQTEAEQDTIDEDPEIEFKKERHMLNGGWMHRSRSSFEVLQDRK